MGKGSNVQKKVQAQLRGQKDKGKSEEERRVARLKSEKDKQSFMCEVCRQTFMANARPPLLYQHVVAKHPTETDPLVCFPEALKGYNPDGPKEEGTAASADGGAPKPKKAVKKSDHGLDALLDAGLKSKKKK